jgi:hypothetical protein
LLFVGEMDLGARILEMNLGILGLGGGKNEAVEPKGKILAVANYLLDRTYHNVVSEVQVAKLLGLPGFFIKRG